MRPIDADLLLAVARAMQSETEETAYNFLNDAQNPSTEWECVEGLIENAQTLDVAPVFHAHFTDNNLYFETMYECSNCKYLNIFAGAYCTNCGAKMDER